MSKKRKKVNVNSYSSDSDEMIRMLKVLGLVVLALVLFYLVFAIANGEIKFGKDKYEKVPDEIQNVEILAGSTFNRQEESYYVLFYNFDTSSSIGYANAYDLYTNMGEDKMFLVDTNKGFNKNYLTDDKTKINISGIDKLKVVDGTLIRVEKGKGVSYKVGLEEINKTLFD